MIEDDLHAAIDFSEASYSEASVVFSMIIDKVDLLIENCCDLLAVALSRQY